MRKHRLARLALATSAVGALGLMVGVPAWAMAAAPVTTSTLTAIIGTTDTCSPQAYGDTKCKTESPSPTGTHESKSATPSGSTSTSTTPSESKSTSTAPAGVPTSKAPTLPVTGPATTALVAAGSGLVLGGALLLARLRRRRAEG